MRVLFLDVDGVLNRSGFEPADGVELASWIEPPLAAHLATALREIDAEVVMASDWRIACSLDQLRAQLARAGIAGALRDVTPVLEGQPRWREIEAWMVEHRVHPEDIVIVDDELTMGPLGWRHVRTTARDGLDAPAAAAIVAMFAPR